MGRSQRHLREIYGRDSSGNEKGSVKNDPQVLTIPTKSGTATVGQQLTGVNGTFRGPSRGGTITITRQWMRFTGATGVAIAGATGATYTIQAADQGKTIKFRNIATNSYGSTTADSTPTSTIP